MEPMLITADDLENDSEEELLVHAWRTEQLRRLGLHRILARDIRRPHRLARAGGTRRARMPSGARTRHRPLKALHVPATFPTPRGPQCEVAG
jgi:hypothetical protein